LSAPEKLFLLIASIAGLVLVALIPPLGGGNEDLNFQRTVGVATGHVLVGPFAMPGGLADLLQAGRTTFPEGAKPPLGYSREQFDRVASLELRADQPEVVQPSPIAVLHPVSYLPQVPVVVLGIWLGLPPLVIFYLGRLAGLAAGIALTFFAIRIMPVHKHSLAGVALLPPILFSRSTLDADQFTNGLAFLFLALTIREIARRGPLERSRAAGLALGAFLLAQAKSAYLLLPLLALAIPVERFGSRARKALVCLAITLPGIVASGAYMLLLRQSYFTELKYRTWSGVVEPDRQIAYVLSEPLTYAGTLLHTVFATAFIPNTIIGFLGIFGPPVMMPVLLIALLAFLLIGTILSEERVTQPQLNAWPTRALALAIAAVTIGIILTLLYLQWTRFGAPTIDGFRGQYLYPLAPLLLLAMPAGGRRIFSLTAPGWLAILAAVSVAGTWWMTWWTYLA
jgi:uncharacterized membrane protein